MMQIKSFSAPRLHEALALVRQELGPDAVILDRTESKDTSGSSIWSVHAALDLEPDVPQKQLPSKHLEQSLARLERLATTFGERSLDEYRQTMVSRQERDTFDHLVGLGVSGANAFDMVEDYAKHKPISMPTLAWTSRIQPEKKREVILFSGASGAGKTLLIAKLAMHYSLKGVSIALLTTDVERMGGSELLSAYADVLGTPCFKVSHEEDVEPIMKKIKSAQLVLIDTEGWNNRHISRLRKQAKVWDAFKCTHRILLMPASMDENDGLAMLQRASDLRFTDIAFSKLDETSKPGKIVNWAEASCIPMSYCSFGPEVPGQMGWLTPKALTAILIKHDRQQENEQKEEMIA